MDRLPNELLNEVSDNLPLREYLNFIISNPRAYDNKLLEQKVIEDTEGYPYEIITYDLADDEKGIVTEYRAGKIRIEVDRTHIDHYPLYEGNLNIESFYTATLYFGDIINFKLEFDTDNSDSNPFTLRENRINLEKGNVNLNLTEIEAQLVKELEDDVDENDWTMW